MTITYQQFVADFPEFRDANAYPQSGFNFWLNFSTQLLNTDKWGQPAAAGDPLTLYDLGTELFIAHNLVLEKRANEAAAAGGNPGEQVGPVNSKSVGPVSVAYDTANAIEKEGGNFNLTVYGTRLLRLMNMAGAGVIYLGAGNATLGQGTPWFGPWPFPAPTSFV